MTPYIFETPYALLEAVGTTLGPTDWFNIEQARIDLFAEATDDHQWIHVDPGKAKEGPFGATIAHGYLTLSLINRFLPELIDVRRFTMGINVGMDNVRFLAPVPVGSRIRGTGELIAAEEKKGGIQSVMRVTVEIEGKDKTACIADTISRYYPETDND